MQKSDLKERVKLRRLYIGSFSFLYIHIYLIPWVGNNVVLTEAIAFNLAPGCDENVTSFSQNRWVAAPVKSQVRYLIKDVCLERIFFAAVFLKYLVF